MLRTKFIAALLPLTLAACATPPASTLAVPRQFTQATADNAGTVVESHWWTVFDDPQLDALIAATIAHNRDLRMAVGRLERARALGRAEDGRLWPTGSGGASAIRAHVPGVNTPSVQPRIEDRIGASVDLSWEIDLFGRLRAAARAASFEVNASADDVLALRAMLLADVAGAYFAWQGVQAQSEALAAIIDGQQQQLELAETRFRFGATDELDVNRAHGELRASQARMTEFQGELARLASRIAVLSGRFPGELALAVRAESATTTAKPVALGTPQWVLSRRPDVGAAEARLRAAIARSDAAWADLLPRLTLGGSFGVLAGGRSDLFGSAARAWALQPALAVPLFDLLQLVPLKDARDAEARLALATYENTVLGAVADVEASAGVQRSSVQRVRLLAERNDDAAKALRIAEARYEAGSIDQLALIDAQRTARAAALELAAAIADHRIAVVQLYRAIGATA